MEINYFYILTNTKYFLYDLIIRHKFLFLRIFDNK